MLTFAIATTAAAQSATPVLLRGPSVSQTQIAFSCGGDIWTVNREGGDAKRLTAGIGIERGPAFSPDGTQIAFTGEYDGNVDVYVVPAAGGVPRRLTFHPGEDEVVGWTPDGTRVLFRSRQTSYTDAVVRLFTVPVEGGFPTEVPLTRAAEGSFSPDGARLAYVPIQQWQRAWKRYRGGQTRPIWIAALADSHTETTIPRENSNDFNPMWVGDTIYFLSDRNGPVTLFAYDLKSQKVTEVVKNAGLDIKSASAGPGAIVYEQFGALHVFDLGSGRDRELSIRVVADVTEVRPHFQKVESRRITRAALSPTGARAVFGARGEILTVPPEKGDIRNLTNTTAAVERDPAWAPDGASIAYLSDESGEYALHVRDQSGLGAVRKFDLGTPPTFYYSPVWSPDSKKIAYSDKRLTLWYVDVDKKTPVKVDTDTYAGPYQAFDPSWSPDSRWVAYTKQLRNYLHAVFVYSVEQGKSYQVTDGMSDALYPVFDKEGKYLYLTASTDTSLRTGWLDMSSLNRPVTRSVYVLVLRKDVPSPLAPESDEEKPGDALKTDKEKDAAKDATKERGKDEKPVSVQIDLDNIGQRLLSLPIPARNYTALQSRKAGVLFLVEGPAVDPIENEEDGPSQTLHMFDLKTRKTEKILEGIGSFDLSFNGEKMLYQQKGQWAIALAQKPTGAPPKPGEGGPLKLDAMQVYVDPRAEWTAHVLPGVARRARLLVRPRPARTQPRDNQEEVRALSGSAHQPRRPELPVRRDARRHHDRAHVCRRRRPPRSDEGQGRTARRGLRDRERPVSVRARLQRRELEPEAARAPDRTRRQCPPGRVPARGEWTRTTRERHDLRAVRGDRGETGRASRRAESRRHRRPSSDRRPDRGRYPAYAISLGLKGTAARSMNSPAGGSPMSICRTRTPAATRTSIATTSRRSVRRP